MTSSSVRRSAALALCAIAALQPAARADTSYEQECARLAASREPDAARLNALFKLDWDHGLRESPEFATDVGDPRFNDRWTDNSPGAIERRKRELSAPLKVLESIRPAGLTAADRLNLELFRFNLDNAIDGARFKGEYMPLNQLGGVQIDPAETLELAPHAAARDYQNLIARLNSLPVLIDQTIVLLHQGLQAGITPPQITLRDVPQQVQDQMDANPESNPLLKSFRVFPADFSEADRERLRRDAAAALHQKIIPAYARLRDYLTNSYLPGARQSLALSDLPDGKAWYAYAVRTATTTRMSPEEIHRLGLSEVKRIRAEMDKVIAETGFKGSFAQFSVFLRTDPRFFHTNAQDLLRDYRDIAKRIDPELIRFFGKLPRLPYGVLPIPSYAERSAPAAYYQPGSYKAGRAGFFYANTYALDTRPSWEMGALTAHEAVPGHHLQISLAQEMTDVPEFRKYGGYTAFVEGWGLYAEGLAGEMGLYKDPYMKFGQLTYEMWRAVRLVVDTGIHSMGWTRQQAIDFFMANTSKSEHDVTVEVDRYIVWPGQALAYKVGQLKFKELRACAKQELGDRFDVRKFHDQVLSNGALPLDVLDRQVKDWVAAQKAEVKP
jgi:uncharacterized protein (DUF885 family)